MGSKRIGSFLLCMALLLNLSIPNVWMPIASADGYASPIFFDDFENASTANLFQAEYMSLPDDSTKPMYLKTGGNITADQGTVTIASGRMTIGSRSNQGDTATSVLPNGIFDLSRPYQIIIDVSSVDGTNTSKAFQVYVDNNTTSSGSSFHGSSSKLYSAPVSDIAGQTIVIDSVVGTTNSFIQIRTETGATVFVDSVAIVYTGDGGSTGPTDPTDPPESTIPRAPIVTASAGEEEISLSWNDVDGADQYNVKRSIISGGPYDPIRTLIGSTLFVDSEVVAGTTYYYIVTAIVGGRQSDPSNEAHAILYEPVIQPPASIFLDDFDHATQSNLFTTSYLTLPNDPTKPMYVATSGASRTTVDEVNGTLEISNARLTIGALSSDLTTVGSTPGGVFDLSRPYQIIIQFSSGSGTGNFQVFVDNNTSSSAASIHGSSSVIFKKVADTIESGQVVIPATVGTENSFIQLRSESNATVVIDSIAIVYQGEVDPTIPPTPTDPLELQAEYNIAGFSYGATGGGNLAETDPLYIKVYNAEDLAEAINRKKGPNKDGYRVIEIMNDLNLGWNEISDNAKASAGDIFRANNPAHTHPVLMETGISKIELKNMHDVTIFSANGAKIKHAGIVMKSSTNIIIRNLEFDELWEWDEATKGDYDKNDWDFLTLEQSSKVWIDHCTFNKSYDGGVDIKKGTSGVTISWSLFQGDDRSANSWVTQQINALEINKNSYTMYKYLRDQGLSIGDIIAISSGQKKQHLIGATSFDSLNPQLETTLHHNYYKDMMDRMPRLRGGNAHAYNIVMDSAAIRDAGKRITPEQSAAISSKGYKFGVTSNGAISTEGGAVLVEKSHIIDLLYPIRNNQTDPNNPSYTGKIVAKDTIYSLDGVTFRGDSTTQDSPLAPIPAVPIEFSWNGMTELPYMYTPDDPGTLMDRLTANNGAGAGKLSWSKENWLLTMGYDGSGDTGEIDPGEVDPPPVGVAPVSPTNVAVIEGVNSIALKWKASGPITPPIIQEGDLIAAPNGQDSNLGTLDSPLSLTSAITKITPGGTIYLLDGIYNYSVPVTIERNNNGDAVDARKKIIAYNTGGAVLDFYGQTFDSTNRGLQIFGSYWLVQGIEVKGAGDNGIFIGGNYNIIENVETHHNRDSGLQISRYSSTALDSEWPSYNEIINVYSHDNFDPDNGEDADGFAAKLTIGPGNIFDGCIAAYNVDDGWDLFTKTATGPIGVVTIRNSISYANGKTSDGNETSNSDGNGFKLGGEKIAVNHIVENNIAFMNKKHGFTWNSNPGSITMSNNTSWSNGQSNFAFDQGTHVFTNNLSYKGKASDKTSGNDVQSTNVWWHNTKGSMNAKGLKADDSDFVSLIPTIARNADGSPNIGEFLKLAAMSDMKGAGTPSGMDIGAIF